GFDRFNIAFRQFHCLRETGGPVPVVSEIAGSDEVEFKLKYFTANGASGVVNVERCEGIDSGSIRYYEAAPALVFEGDPGEYFDIEVVGYEVDEGLGIETGRVKLGPTRKRLWKQAFPLFSTGFDKKVRLMIKSDLSEYVISVDCYIS
ncbi:MAG TPA: hypothetical protein VEC37_18735, partial [Bacillota bacterium]|nr:hypothetical protein [Bacillota bacterium]